MGFWRWEIDLDELSDGEGGVDKLCLKCREVFAF